MRQQKKNNGRVNDRRQIYIDIFSAEAAQGALRLASGNFCKYDGIPRPGKSKCVVVVYGVHVC